MTVRSGGGGLAGQPAAGMLGDSTRAVRMGHTQDMISVAVRGYGIVIWEREGAWRTYTASDALSALLSTRVEIALHDYPADLESQDAVCAALLSIDGAHLLAVGCDHGPGECDDDLGGIDRN